MISKKMADAINEQINAELYSSYLYLSMAADFGSKIRKGAAHWMRLQAHEELGHAMKFYDYLNERGAPVKLKAIKQPKQAWKTMLEAFSDAYEHEQHVTGLLSKLMKLAIAEDDFATQGLLQWYIDEQVEEESTASEIVGKLKMIKESPGSLYHFDRELGKRKAGGE
jgi:ferritin